MKKTVITLALAAAPLAASASESNDIGYNYVQLDGVYADAGDGLHPRGARLSGSYAFTDDFFTTARLGRVADSQDFGGNYSDKAWSLGVGFNKAIGTRADWVSQLAYVRSTREMGNMYGSNPRILDIVRTHTDGYDVSTGVLAHVTDKLTAHAYIGYMDLAHDNTSGSAYADFGMVYAFNKTWGLDFGVKLIDGAETYSVGVRANF